MVDRILLARFDIDMTALGHLKVARMDFRPYQDILDQYLGQVKQLRYGQDFKKYEKTVPVRRLNNVLTASAPMLIHAFEEYGKGGKGLHSDSWFSERWMLALHQDSMGNPLWKPDAEHLNDLIAVWAVEWFKEQFAEELKTRSARGLIDKLNEAIRSVQPVWNSEFAANLWETVKYNALPSVMAAIFVERMKGWEYPLNGEMPLRWRLTKEGTERLAVVSEPGTGGSRQGLFSYKIEFVLQTQAGRKNHWIAVYLRIRRWADRAIKQVNFGRKVSVMVTLHSERKPGWQFVPTMIKLQVAKNGNGYYWAEHEQKLLQAWQARELPDPNDLFAHPGNYHQSESDADTYHILHAEGITYKGSKTHAMAAGTSLAERTELMGHIGDVMKGILTPDTLMETDEISTIAPAQVIKNRLMPMYVFDDLEPKKRKSGAVLLPRSSKPEVQKTCHQMMINALFRASGDKPVNIMLVASEAPAQEVMEREVRRLLFMEEHEEFPEGIHISYIAPELHHQSPPATHLPLYPSRKEIEEKKYQHELNEAWKKKVAAWEKLIKPYAPEEMCNLALIEIPKHDRDDWLKRAIRRACVNSGVLSQMLTPIPREIATNPDWHKYSRLRGEIGRIRNALKDLLLRQMNVLYGALPEVYCFAGLSEETAENLVVIGMYRHKTTNQKNKSPVDFPVAVELHPDGRVMVVIPDKTGKPQKPVLYTEAATTIGKLLAGGDTKSYQFEKLKLSTFAKAILTQKRENAVLMLFEADGWRSGILPLKNGELAQVINRNGEQQSYQITLDGRTYTPENLSGVRMLRLRDQGTLGETPQYVAANTGSTWTDWTEFGDPATMIGVVDKRSDSPFHFFSIGRQLQAVSKDNEAKNDLYSYGEGGDVAFKHQQAVEIVPFFLQSGDDPLVFCRIAHFLRTSPAWAGGNTVLPYPLHLAHTLFDDQMAVFNPDL